VDLGGLRMNGDEGLLELAEILGAAGRGLEPCVLRAHELLARLAQERLHAHDVGGQHFSRRNEP
jgi:hypothetical protein